MFDAVVLNGLDDMWRCGGLEIAASSLESGGQRCDAQITTNGSTVSSLVMQYGETWLTSC
jgi:hypothetical protein